MDQAITWLCGSTPFSPRMLACHHQDDMKHVKLLGNPEKKQASILGVLGGDGRSKLVALSIKLLGPFPKEIHNGT